MSYQESVLDGSKDNYVIYVNIWLWAHLMQYYVVIDNRKGVHCVFKNNEIKDI